jgi:hypothetical protein
MKKRQSRTHKKIKNNKAISKDFFQGFLVKKPY